MDGLKSTVNIYRQVGTDDNAKEDLAGTMLLNAEVKTWVDEENLPHGRD